MQLLEFRGKASNIHSPANSPSPSCWFCWPRATTPTNRKSLKKRDIIESTDRGSNGWAQPAKNQCGFAGSAEAASWVLP